MGEGTTIVEVGHGGLRVLADRWARVVVIGGGMAGFWTGYQLVRAGVPVLLVTYDRDDRGGVQGASRRSAGAVSTAPLSLPDFEAYLKELGRGQVHPSVAGVYREHLAEALEEVRGLVPWKPIKIGFAVAAGGGEALLRELRARFLSSGGEVLDGWVTRLVVDEVRCQGLQYETPLGIGRIRCDAMVLASGGYSGLFANAIRTHCHGTVLGAFLRSGGVATNLEFLFKHGYGNVDANALTPTEELPGAEIFDSQQVRVRWLEEALFEGRGTRTHLKAVQFWLRNAESEYFVDLAYRELYLRLRGVGLETGLKGRGGVEDGSGGMEGLLELFPDAARGRVLDRVRAWLSEHGEPGYRLFEALKAELPRERGVGGGARFRVRPLTYFSMGGIGHVGFRTNLCNVFVNGEAMHDFGADRVGGLPWSLYLAGGYVIRDRIRGVLGRAGGGGVESAGGGFELVERRARFDAGLLREIQDRLYSTQEREMTAATGEAAADGFRQMRIRLEEGGEGLSDAVGWLLVAEAILECSLVRRESRGFFFRCDHPVQDGRLDDRYTCAWYDPLTRRVTAELLAWDQVAARVGPGGVLSGRAA